MFRGHYDGWTQSRMSAVKKYINVDILKGKTLLELGGGHGHNGNEFHNLGCKVTSSDARREHLQVGMEMFPHMDFKLVDGDKDDIDEKYDIILHWGLLYHLEEIEVHLKKVCQKCDVILLETEVSDSDDADFYIATDESGYDQAYNKKGIRPSEKYVEKVLNNNGFKSFMVKDPIANSSSHNYDWDITNTKTWRHGLRRFWICWNENVRSPLAP